MCFYEPMAEILLCNLCQGDRGLSGERGQKGFKGDLGDAGSPGQPVNQNNDSRLLCVTKKDKKDISAQYLYCPF